MSDVRPSPVVVCFGCGAPSKDTVNGRCATCAPAHERKRSSTRRHTQPWTRLYKLTRWRKARATAIARDGGRCRLRLSDRCLVRERLVGHHKPTPVAELFERARGDWERFAELACDVDAIVTACVVCHNEDDAAMRVQRRGRASGSVVMGGRVSRGARPVGSRRGSESGCTGLGVPGGGR